MLAYASIHFSLLFKMDSGFHQNDDSRYSTRAPDALTIGTQIATSSFTYCAKRGRRVTQHRRRAHVVDARLDCRPFQRLLGDGGQAIDSP